MDNTKEQEVPIVPSIKTDLEELTTENANKQKAPKCLFIFMEDGKWEATKAVRKLEARWDGTGYLVDKKYIQEVKAFCSQHYLLWTEQDAPDNIDALPYYNPIVLLEQQLEVNARDLISALHNADIKYSELDDVYNEKKQQQIKSHPQAERILSLLSKRRTIQSKITYLENKRSLTHEKSILEDDFTYLLKNNSEEALIAELKNVAPGLTTGYKIGDVDLAFPGGAISIIAAPTSHGKTTALINFSLGALKNNPDKNVYFFSYEESTSSIAISFLNTWIAEEITKGNNRGSIEDYFRYGSTEYMQHAKIDRFKTQKDLFFELLINNGRLKIHYSYLSAGELIEALYFIKKNDEKVGMICIDYMQLLKMPTAFRMSRQEELKQICLMLKDCAVNTGFPIVIAAQFNRTVVSEADLSAVNIGEAGDIERIASLIIGMYNRNFCMMNRDGNKDKDGKKVEKEPTIYFEVLKGRKIGNSHSSIMDFDGNQGKITDRSNPVLIGFENMNTKQKKNIKNNNMGYEEEKQKVIDQQEYTIRPPNKLKQHQ